MTSGDKNNTLDRLVAAYEKMLGRVHDNLDKAESRVPAFKQTLENAREKAVELGELTREEAEKVASYIERDMHDAAVFISETGQQIRDWWQFDLKQIEEQVLEMFAKVADQTSLQLHEMQESLKRAEMYHTGEVTGPGVLVCQGCGKEMNFKKPGHIPPCPGCHGTEFKRKSA